MKIVVGCDFPRFQVYYKTSGRGELGETEKRILMEDRSHCILWMEGQEILGHVLWHECSTLYHRKGDFRDKADREILEVFFGKNKPLVELHEVWLKEEYRKRGYGTKFFEFFEDFIKKKEGKNIVYYADHPAAMAICRNRGYKEAYYEELNWYVFGKSIE